jgi:tape measure domain-containing protein
MAFTVSYIFEAVDRYTKVADKIIKKNKQVEASLTSVNKITAAGTKAINEHANSIKRNLNPALDVAVARSNKFVRNMNRVTSSTRAAKNQQASFMQRTAKAGSGIQSAGESAFFRYTVPGAIAAGYAVTQYGNIEQLNVAFETMLSNVQLGRKLVNDLIEFAATTPFELPELGRATKILLSFGAATGKEVIPMLRQLGDIAAGTGGDVQGLARAFGQVKAKERLQMEEVLQFADRGVPILAALADLTDNKMSKLDIMKLISQGAISFEAVALAIKKMTMEGGKFHRLMEKQALTINGLLSTMRDRFRLVSAEIGMIIVETAGGKEMVKSLNSWLQGLTGTINKFATENPKIAKFLAIVTLLTLLIAPLVIGFGAILAIIAVVGGAAGFAFSIIAVAVAAIIAGFAIAYTWGEDILAQWDKITAKLDYIHDRMARGADRVAGWFDFGGDSQSAGPDSKNTPASSAIALGNGSVEIEFVNSPAELGVKMASDGLFTLSGGQNIGATYGSIQRD